MNMHEWKGHRTLYWEDGSLTGMPGPIFVEADVEGHVQDGVLIDLTSTNDAWVVTLPAHIEGHVPWMITRIGDHTVPGWLGWEWA